jgi:hypothetical protein
MNRYEGLFEIGGPMVIGTQMCENFGNAEKLFATLNLIIGLPVFFAKDLNQLRHISQNSINGHVISRKMI